MVPTEAAYQLTTHTQPQCKELHIMQDGLEAFPDPVLM